MPMFSSRTFMVSQLIFKSFMYLEFIFVYSVSWCSSFTFLYVAVQISQHHSLKGYLYSILRFCPPCQKLIDRRDLGFFLASLFSSIVLCVYSYASTRVFWLPWLCNIFYVRYSYPSYFLIISQNYWGYSGSFIIQYKFLKCFLYLWNMSLVL